MCEHPDTYQGFLGGNDVELFLWGKTHVEVWWMVALETQGHRKAVSNTYSDGIILTTLH